MDEVLRSLLWTIFCIIPVILLLGSWVFGSRVLATNYLAKDLKEYFYVFRILMMFYFGGMFLIYVFFQLFDL
jgi:uncharacterized BrkB/YihY/UPF0761 family membrane protein|tara:strand:+ start:184 stop:399 length:216 start_codon:yes stop_codon:yes gene_type:complete